MRKVKVDLGSKDSEIKSVEIMLNGAKYTVTASGRDKLRINKYDIEDSALAVFPKYGNVIEIK